MFVEISSLAAKPKTGAGAEGWGGEEEGSGEVKSFSSNHSKFNATPQFLD